MMLTAEAVEAHAQAIGFDLCGIAPAISFPELSFLQIWLERGFAGDMAYMSPAAPTYAACFHRRNLAVALGNSGSADAARALADPVGEPSKRDPIVLEHVDWARRKLALTTW